MKNHIFLLVFAITLSLSFTSINKGKQELSKVSHFGSNINVKNFDGTHSTIYVSGSSALLMNPDGSRSVMDFYGRNSSFLTAADGTSSTVSHNKRSSTVFNSDGSRMIVNHMQTTSTCWTDFGKHSITHNFGHTSEMCFKRELDVLIHRNWAVMRQAQDSNDVSDDEVED